MTDLLAQYGPLGAVVVILAGVVSQLVRTRRGSNGHAERRVSMAELRDDDIRDFVLTPLVTRVAILERDVQHLSRNRPG